MGFQFKSWVPILLVYSEFYQLVSFSASASLKLRSHCVTSLLEEKLDSVSNLTLRPFDAVPQAVATPTMKLFSMMPRSCNSAIFMNCNINNWDAGYLIWDPSVVRPCLYKLCLTVCSELLIVPRSPTGCRSHSLPGSWYSSLPSPPSSLLPSQTLSSDFASFRIPGCQLGAYSFHLPSAL